MHSRSSDTVPVLVHVETPGCSATGVATYLTSLGMQLAKVKSVDLAVVQVPPAPVVLIGDQILAEGETLSTLQEAMRSMDEERLVIVFTRRALSFEERLQLSSLGHVRVFSPTETKRVRDLIRDWMRDRTMHGYRVLLVEDSRTDAYLANKYMVDVGIEVQHIRSAGEVLEAIEVFEPDLIVSDLHMPGCDGDQMAKVIRQDIEATLPIIFLSSEGDSTKQLNALAAGADGFIRKPLLQEPFIRALKSTIRRSVALENRMRRDFLTNLLNRSQFDCHMRRVAQRGEPCALAVLDIDHFKNVNDRYGHPVGDQVICRLAGVLEDGVRSTDYVGRMGGEEFALLMPGCQLLDAIDVLNRLRVRFADIEFDSEGETFRSTVSVGVTMLKPAYGDAYKVGDDALYESKKMGRNRVTARP